LNFKHLFGRSLAADTDRLDLSAQIINLWPVLMFSEIMLVWSDAAQLADRKWEKVMGDVWPEAQAHVARELGSGDPESIVFSPNTHDFLIRLTTAAPRKGPKLKILTSDGEFHSARRQFTRWEEERWIDVERIAAEPFDSFTARFLGAARREEYDLIFISQLMFGSGRLFEAVDELAGMARTDGPWVVIDGYHAFMAIHRPFGPAASRNAFYLGGGYKYAMAGEGCAFMHAPAGYGPRPPVTGWFAEFEDLSLPPGTVGYAPDGRRFLGATFDPSGLYRFNAVQRMLADEGLTTERISEQVTELQARLLDSFSGTALAGAELLNPANRGPHARFLAFRSPQAQHWHQALKARNCITDVRGDVLRIGFAIYQDEADVERLVAMLKEIG
jgi:selenocysteine lyase/cysteine desulfurase